MEQRNESKDPLKRLIDGHKDISEYVEDFGEILTFLHDEKAKNRLESVITFMNENLREHFRFEEEVVFSAILLHAATPESVKLILELQKEHGAMLETMDEFLPTVFGLDSPADKAMHDRMEVAIRKIVGRKLAHASKEDDKLLPIIEQNKQLFDKQ